MRIVFLGTPEFSVPILQALARSQYQVVAVYTQQDQPAGRGLKVVPSPVKRAALELGLPVFQPSRLRDPAEAERLASLQPDVLVLAAYGQLLPPRVLEIPPRGCLNVHPSLLPRHRGPTPIPSAILAGDEETGATLMLMDPGMDSGPLLAQRRYPVASEDTAGSLTQALARLGADLLLEALPRWLDKEIAPQPQDEAEVTYTHLLTKAEGAINWRLSALELWRRVRALHPWPGCYTWWRGRVLKVLEAAPVLGPGGGVPGRVVALEGQPWAAPGVETGHGVLRLLQVQLEGKRALPSPEFLRGQPGFLGSVLPSAPLPRH